MQSQDREDAASRSERALRAPSTRDKPVAPRWWVTAPAQQHPALTVLNNQIDGDQRRMSDHAAEQVLWQWFAFSGGERAPSRLSRHWYVSIPCSWSTR